MIINAARRIKLCKIINEFYLRAGGSVQQKGRILCGLSNSFNII